MVNRRYSSTQSSDARFIPEILRIIRRSMRNVFHQTFGAPRSNLRTRIHYEIDVHDCNARDNAILIVCYMYTEHRYCSECRLVTKTTTSPHTCKFGPCTRAGRLPRMSLAHRRPPANPPPRTWRWYTIDGISGRVQSANVPCRSDRRSCYVCHRS